MKILVLVDLQKDFIDGALGSPEAQAMIPNVVNYIKDCSNEYGSSMCVILTKVFFKSFF